MTQYWQEQKDGSFAITEQGDLGLGLTPINESEQENQKDKKDKKNEASKIFGVE